MLDFTSEQLELTRAILRRRVPGVPVRAFGSRVAGKARRYSDLDLAIGGERPMPYAVLAELANDFSESDLEFRVDIVDWASTSQEFKAAVVGRMELVTPP